MQNLRKRPQGFLRHAFVGCLVLEGVRGAALGVQARPAGTRAALAATRGRAPRAPGRPATPCDASAGGRATSTCGGKVPDRHPQKDPEDQGEGMGPFLYLTTSHPGPGRRTEEGCEEGAK